MDLVIFIVGGIVLGYLVSKLLTKFAPDVKPSPKKEEPTKDKPPARNHFAEMLGNGKKCPPHAWRDIHKDKYGLKCDWCGTTYP